jgi:hypothetical protein
MLLSGVIPEHWPTPSSPHAQTARCLTSWDTATVTSGLQQHRRAARHGPWTSEWLWSGEYIGVRGAMLLLLGVFALGVGAWALTKHHAPTPDSMSSDTRPRLPNGTIAPGTSLSVAEAITRHPARPVAIHGYFEASDDGPHLCARLNGYSECRGQPHLKIGVPYHWLFKGRNRLRGLETGCCSIGSWSPHPVVLQGKVRDRTLLLLTSSG